MVGPLGLEPRCPKALHFERSACCLFRHGPIERRMVGVQRIELCGAARADRVTACPVSITVYTPMAEIQGIEPCIAFEDYHRLAGG